MEVIDMGPRIPYRWREKCPNPNCGHEEKVKR